MEGEKEAQEDSLLNTEPDMGFDPMLWLPSVHYKLHIPGQYFVSRVG